MFDWFRNLRKSAAEIEQEMLSAYIDGKLSASEERRFKQMLQQDADLKAELESQQQIKQMLSSMPRMKAPRNFVLSPAEYAAPEKPSPLIQLYPLVRNATMVAALLFAVTVGLTITTSSNNLATRQESVAMAPVPTIEPTLIIQATAEASFASEAESEAEMGEVAAASAPAEESLAEADAGFDMDAADDAMEVEALAPSADTIVAAATPTPAGTPSLGATEPLSPRDLGDETVTGERVTTLEDDQPQAAAVENVDAGTNASANNNVEPSEAVAVLSENELFYQSDDFATVGAEAANDELARNNTVLRWLIVAQFVLGLIALSLLIATLVLRRRMRRI